VHLASITQKRQLRLFKTITAVSFEFRMKHINILLVILIIIIIITPWL
jgi:hypothetical protein